ncbi:fibrinogen-like protein 1 [Drosophila hydei]|uniref:Fibrinogen-like protein 1 n=1 Tax=Drosophila hydei TaxID=7224 RepID=A0A6J1LPJ3_DROHY|nr:fibrinogen-like protein 1 [Drosophila hydei]
MQRSQLDCINIKTKTMKALTVLGLILLACPSLRSENFADELSSLSTEQLQQRVKHYNELIESSEKLAEALELEFNEIQESINFDNSAAEFESMRKLSKEYREMKANSRAFEESSKLYRDELLRIEPLLCLDDHQVNGYAYGICGGDSTAGPGWTVIQRRIDDTLHFNQSFQNYHFGFGNSNSNFFIGLQKIYELTNFKPHELYIRLKSITGETKYARYSCFKIQSQHQDFRLSALGDYVGNAGDALGKSLYKQFKIYSKGDNDPSTTSGWWIGNGYEGVESNLNALPSQWNTWPVSLINVEMLIRPRLAMLDSDKYKYSC